MRFSLTQKAAAPVIGDRCVRHLLRYATCQACADACPVAALAVVDGNVELAEERCLHCGDCLFVCPTEAIGGITTVMRHYLDDRLVAPLSFRAASTAELLLWHRLYHLRAVACDPDMQPGWVLAVAQLNLTLRQYQEPQWRIVPPNDDGIDTSRRALMRAPASAARSARVPAGRRVLRQLYPQMSDWLPDIDPRRCQLCGACWRSCPEQALRLENENMVTESARCTGCGNCQAVCQHQAVTLSAGPRHEPVRQLPLVSASCTSCQRTFLAWRTDRRVCPTCAQHQYGMRGHCC